MHSLYSDADYIHRVKPSWAEQVEQGDDAGMSNNWYLQNT